jgi:hypothetical protein
MSEEDLILWRDHLVDSFTPGSTYPRKFRFLRKDGLPPRLTMLVMGSKKSPTTKRKGKKGRNLGAPEALARHLGRKRKNISKPVVDEEESAEESGADSEGPDLELPSPKRVKLTRASAANSAERVKKQVALLTSRSPSPELEESQAPPSRKAVHPRPRPRPLASTASPDANLEQSAQSRARLQTQTSLPGSEEGRERAVTRSSERELAKSHYFQTREMQGGTLPLGWSRPGYLARSVSIFFLLNKAHLL